MANARGQRRSYLSDVFVFFAMALVSSALGVFLVVQLGYDHAIAGFAAAACFASLTSGHILLRRNDSVARLQRQLHQQPSADTPSHSFEGQIDALRSAQEDQIDLGQYRPSDDKALKAALQGEPEGLARLQPKAAEPTFGNRGLREPALNDREQIGRVIQRLADDLSQGRPSEAVVPVAVPAGPQPPALPAQAPAVEQAVPAQPTAGDKLAAIADALSNERVEVFLEPIHGLEDGAARHYEVTIRLAMMDGQVLDQAAYSEATRGSAILPLIDAVKVSHTKRVGLQLLRRGKSGALISQINGESVRESDFSDDLSTIMGVDQVMAGRLILAFSQHDVRNFGPGQWEAIERLRTIGFRFAIGDIVDLDIDFEYLAQRGFTFARLDAAVFRQGLRLGEALVPPADICRHLALAGLTLIVDRLTTDRDVAEVFGFGALFGQGTLFGGPRPVKAHVLREDPRDVAAQSPQNAAH